jgi:hypothetical protein
VEYAIVDPFDDTEVGDDFFDFDGMFFIDLSKPYAAELQNTTAGDLREDNLMLVRRILDTDGDVRPNTTQVVAEFVTNFEVSFLVDTKASPGDDPSLVLVPADPSSRSTAQTTINSQPEDVRAVIIELGVRNPLEDRDVAFLPDAGTRFEVDPGQAGSARVRNIRIEIPVMNVARRNL